MNKENCRRSSCDGWTGEAPMMRTDRRQFLISSAACAAAALGLTEGQPAFAQAGLPAQDILVFDRYHDDFVQAGYPGILPAGVRWATAAKAYEPVQLDITGYDPDVFLEVPLVARGIEDPNDPSARRSHVSL